jgi:hypothetical protein
LHFCRSPTPTTITDVHQQYGNIEAVRASWQPFQDKSTFLQQLSWTFGERRAAAGAKVLSEKYAEVLPESIAVSPEVACLIAIEGVHYQKKMDKQENHVMKHSITIPFAMLYAILSPSPHSVFTVGKQTKSFVDALRGSSDALDRIEAEANQTVKTVVGMYKLTETSPGEYALKLGNWHAGVSYSNGHMTFHDPMINWRSIGVDKNLDMRRIKLFIDKKKSENRGI